MQLEITPEPTPDERKAIAKAIAALVAEDGRPAGGSRGVWWREGLREAVEDEDEPESGAP